MRRQQYTETVVSGAPVPARRKPYGGERAETASGVSTTTSRERSTETRPSGLVGAIAFLVPFLTIGWLGFDQGGYFPPSWGWGCVCLSLFAAGVILCRGEHRIPRLAWIIVGSLSSLVILAGLSVAWSAAASEPILEAQRTLFYAVAVVAAFLTLSDADPQRFVGGVLGAIVVVCLYCLGSRVLPSLIVSDVHRSYRLHGLVGYWNAVGALATMGTPLALGVTVHTQRAWARSASAAMLVLFPVTIYFTFSRAAAGALLVGVIVTIALDASGSARAKALWMVPCSGAAVWLAAHSEVHNRRGFPVDEISRQGRGLAIELLVLAAAGSAMAWLATAVVQRSSERRRLLVPASVMGICVLMIAGIGLALVSRQTVPPPQASIQIASNLGDRFQSVSDNGRLALWQVAWQQFRENPLLGSGAGSFERYWWSHRPTDATARDAHNLYLESMAELGPLGLLFVVGAVFVPLLATLPRRGSWVIAASSGAVVAYGLQAAVDWHWEVPVVTLTALFCGAAMVAAADPRATRVVPRPFMRFAFGATFLGVGAMAAVGLVGNLALWRSQVRARDGQWTGVESAARKAAAWMPWSAAPTQILAESLFRRGHVAEATREAEAAIRKDRTNWRLWFDRARFSEGADWQEAYARALELNPKSAELAAFRSRMIRGAALSGKAAPPRDPPASVSTGEQAPLDRPPDLAVDFAGPDAPARIGFRRDRGARFDPERRMGWDAAVATRERQGRASPELRTFAFSQDPRRWTAEVPNGDYLVRVNVGDLAFPQGPHLVKVGDEVLIDRVRTAKDEFAVSNRRVSVRTGRLEVTIGGGGGITTINFLEAWLVGPDPSSLRSVNFQPADAPTPVGFLVDSGEPFSSTRGYGWDARVGTRDRRKPVPHVLDTLVFTSESREWNLALPNGWYRVWFAMGDPEYSQGPHRLRIEGEMDIQGERTPAGRSIERSVLTMVTDGSLSVELGDGKNTSALNYITVQAVPAPTGEAAPPRRASRATTDTRQQ